MMTADNEELADIPEVYGYYKTGSTLLHQQALSCHMLQI
jgi:hypothetical protein